MIFLTVYRKEKKIKNKFFGGLGKITRVFFPKIKKEFIPLSVQLQFQIQ